jgi:acetyltransferase
MAEIGGGHELLITVTPDPSFGPVIRLCPGDAGSDALREGACALPPLNLPLAHALIAASPMARQLAGGGGRPPAAVDEIALTLVKVAQLIADLDRVAELEIHPLRTDEKGVLALDARVRIAEPTMRLGGRFAIRPYPKRLERELVLKNGRRFLIRPIRPEDAPLLTEFVEQRTTAEDRRLRFFTTVRTLAPELCSRLTQIDYDREMALVAVDPEVDGEGAFCGVVRIAADPDRQRAEYAILVASDMKGQGLGSALMNAIIDYGREHGIAEIYGTVLSQNRGMLDIAERLGFERQRNPDDLELVEVRLPLAREAA